MIIPPEITGQPRGAHALLDPRSPLDVPPERHCGWCGASDTEVPMRVARGDTDPRGPLTRCKNIRECTGRYVAGVEEEMARTEAEAKAAKAAAARPKRAPAAKTGTARAKTATARARPSRARRALLETAQERVSEAPTIVPSEPADPAPGSLGDQDGGGDEAA